MKGLRCWWLLGCLGAVLFGAPSAHAAGGRISFSGAVVEPTCGADGSTIRQVAPGSGVHVTCNASEPGAPASGAYRLIVMQLGSGGASDRLLGYFVGYLRDAGQTDARLVTQVFD